MYSPQVLGGGGSPAHSSEGGEDVSPSRPLSFADCWPSPPRVIAT